MDKLEELKATAAKLQQQIEALEKPKKWEPRKDLCYRSSAFSTRDTLEADNKAHKDMRSHNRLLAYVDEFDGEWVADWAGEGQGKYAIVYSHINDSWLVDWNRSYCSLGTVYMSQECAEGLVAKLRSGEVVL